VDKQKPLNTYLINCSQNEIAAADKNICGQQKISFTLTLPTILHQAAVLGAIRRLTHCQPRLRSLTPHTANRNPTLTVIATMQRR